MNTATRSGYRLEKEKHPRALHAYNQLTKKEQATVNPPSDPSTPRFFLHDSKLLDVRDYTRVVELESMFNESRWLCRFNIAGAVAVRLVPGSPLVNVAVLV